MTTWWLKLRADLRAYRLSFALIVGVLCLGSAAMVAVLDARKLLRSDIVSSFDGAVSPDIVLWFDAVDEGLLAEIARQPGVAAVDARRSTFNRVLSADGHEFPLRLSIVRDPLAMRVGRAHAHGTPTAGSDGGLWIERSGRELLNIADGALLRLRAPDGRAIELTLAGELHDPAVAPSTQERILYGWVSPAVAARLGERATPDQLLVRLSDRLGRADRLERANELAAWAKGRGRAPLRLDAPPLEHPHALLMEMLLRVMGLLAGLAFVSALAWAAYLVALWMKRETRIVGILKTIGASRWQIALQYLSLALPLALVAALLALPLGTWLGELLIAQQVQSLNIDRTTLALPLSWRLIELAVTCALPMLAVAVPVLSATRMTAQRALHDSGVRMPRHTGHWLRLPGDRRWTLALRNGFRRPGRLALIMLALVSGGALLLTTHSNYESLSAAIDRSLAQQGHDIEVALQLPAPGAELEAIARAVPGVQAAEAWRRVGVLLPEQAGDAHEAPRLPLLAYPADSALMRLAVVEGRAPRVDANDEVLASRSLLAAYPALRLGEPVLMRFRDRDRRLRIVGLVEEIGPNQLYAPFASHAALTGQDGDGANALRVKAASGPLEPLARRLDQALLDAQRTPAQLITRERVRDGLDEHFKVVGDFIRMVALGAALLGGLWLAAASGLNVIERTREIGVLRALGAPPRAIASVFLIEGAAITLLSTLIAIVLSLVLTHLANRAAETQLLHVAVPLQFSWVGLLTLMAASLVLIGAVALALRRVLRVSAREALAYE
ncbi:MAG: ABC transporter permease [Burkholderiales bacterium]|nr:ABC transporter permease [Burkholderiales bacterium]